MSDLGDGSADSSACLAVVLDRIGLSGLHERYTDDDSNHDHFPASTTTDTPVHQTGQLPGIVSLPVLYQVGGQGSQASILPRSQPSPKRMQ